jgi:hypothetical protein
MSKERDSNLYNMVMLSFYRANLLMGIWARNMMTNANLGEEVVNLLIFASPVHLDYDDLPVK